MAEDTVARLREVPLFYGCTEKELRFIATRVEELDLPKDKILCTQGESGSEFFVLLSGSAEVRRDGKALRTMKPGDFFGEIALVDNGPRTATVVATAPVRCLVLSVSQFQDVLHQNAEIAVKILYAMGRRLRATAQLPAD